MDKQFVIWAELCDGKYRTGRTYARICIPFGVEVITTVEECDLHMMLRYLKKKLARGWTPLMCRRACGEI